MDESQPQKDKPPLISTVSSESVTSIVSRGWNIISLNSEILILMSFGVIGTVLEVVGYWPEMRLLDLFPVPEIPEVVVVEQTTRPPGCPRVIVEEIEVPMVKNQTDLEAFVYKVNDGVDLALLYSIHIYLAAYMLLPYPVIMEKQRILLTPWLLCGVLRSLLLNLVQSTAGILLCAAQDKILYPCIQFATFKAVELCFSFYLWTSVHNFYYFLDRKKSEIKLSKVLKTIHEAGMKTSSFDSSTSDSLFSLHLLEDDDSGVEVELVERAAMAWIAREILENGEEYMADGQFSEYLAIKATMELRQIIKELAEKRREEEAQKEKSRKKKVEESLAFLKTTLPDVHPGDSKLEAFELSMSLSRRDPIRRIPPLISRGKPYYDDTFSLDSAEVTLVDNIMKDTSATATQAVVEDTVEVQTDPLTPAMSSLFDVLEKQHEKKESRRRGKVKEEKRNNEATSGADDVENN